MNGEAGGEYVYLVCVSVADRCVRVWRDYIDDGNAEYSSG